MGNVHNVIAIIPARGGSKGIPRKNLKTLGGKPLIAWTIQAALKSKTIDRVIVSTEDNEMADIAQEWGAEVPFIRPSELAQDKSTGMETVFHALEMMPNYEWVFLLQPTSPLRTTADIDNIFEFCNKNNGNTSVSVCQVNKHPDWMFEINNNKLTKYINNEIIEIRQELKKIYQLNGALYLAKVDWLKKYNHFVSNESLAYIMPWERSVDIDNFSDWELAEYLIKH